MYLLLSVLCASAVLASAEPKLQLLQELFRHGDRAPEQSFPTDIHKDYWTVGPGELTNVGMLMHYKLGQYTKERYADFLSPYNYAKVAVRSTNYNRTLMSAASDLAGLYPPAQDDQFLPGLAWQPVPVHTVPLEDDWLMFPSCPKSELAFSKFMASAEAIAYITPNMPLYKEALEYAGLPHSTPDEISMGNIVLRDVLKCQQSHNLSMPDWLTEDMWEALDDFTTFFFYAFFASDGTARYQGGPLVQEMRSNMQAKVDGALMPKEREFFIYSGHDSTITAFLGALGIWNNMMPPYAAAVFVELYADDLSGQYSVQILYRNDTAVPAYPLVLDGCDVMCPFEDFLKLTDQLTSNDWAAECALTRRSVIGRPQ